MVNSSGVFCRIVVAIARGNRRRGNFRANSALDKVGQRELGT